MLHLKIHTDASYKEGKCGYAFHIEYVGTEFKLLRSGVGNNIPGSEEAEELAVVKALQFLLDQKLLAKCKKITIYCDSNAAIYNVRSQKTPLGKAANTLMQKLATRLESKQVKIKWVKGHSNNKINNLCDQKAREEINATRGVQERVGSVPVSNKRFPV